MLMERKKTTTYNEYDDDSDYDGGDNRQNINHEKATDANDNDANANATDGTDNDANNHDDDDDDDDTTDEALDGTSTTVNPPTSRTLREMRRLATYFNPIATDYVARHAQRTQATHAIENTNDALDAHDSASTRATDHQSGREEASEAEPDQISGGDLDDHESESTPEQISDGDPELASSAIDFLPHFAFYSTNHFMEPTNMSLASIDLNEAYVQQPILVEPTMFREAYDHPDPAQREKWRAAIQKEFNDMTRRGVWRKVPRTAIPKGRRCIRSKWVFKIKRDGIFRARLVACGYSQIPGVDFTENFAPVINDVTWHILIVAMLIWKLDAVIINVETAFLHGELEEEIYMNLPEGMTGFDDECLLLLKSIYGLVQAARQWNKRLIAILKKIGFKGGYADACLMIRQTENGLVIVSVYVDDNFSVGHKKALLEFVEDLKKEGLSVKVSENLTDYLSCSIKISSDKSKAWIGQPHLIAKLEEKF